MDRSQDLTPTTVALLVGAPLLMLLGRVLAVPLNDQDWEGVLTQAAAHQGRSDTGWLMSLAACGLLGAGAAALVQLLRHAGRSTAAAVAGVTTALGWAGASAICTAGLVFSVLGKAEGRAQQVQVLRDLNAGSTQYVFLLCVLGAAGYAVLSVGLARAGVLARGSATALGLGGAGSLLVLPGPVPAMAVVFALLLLAGHVSAVRAAGSTPTGSSVAEPDAVRA